MAPSPSIEDAFLAYRCTREPEALAQVYDGASARLLSVAIHLTKSPATAEDVVQDTFLVALENPDRWDESKPLMPWLLGILCNRVRQIDGLSRRSIDPARLLVPDPADPQEDYEATELLAHVDEAITHLPQPYRGVVLLRLRNGLSPADISIALGRNPNTVRTQLARGIEMLRKVLPGSVAVLLASSLPAATPSSSRRIVLERAATLRAQLRMQHLTATLRKGIVAMTCIAAVAALAWGLWIGASDAPLASTPGMQPTTRQRADIERAPPEAPAALPIATERQATVEPGAAVVQVLVRGSGIPHAMVELEPLANPPRLFVHHYAYPQRHWRSIESARPLGRDHWQRGTTAIGGRCRFDQLPPGYWVCRSLGIAEVFEVVAGKATTVALTAPANTTIVQGQVLDADGTPIADAPIWKLNRRVRSASVIITHSDQHGRFRASVPPLATLGAFRAGFAPVAVTVSAKEWTSHRNVLLQFAEPGGSLAGTVFNEDGKAAGGVVVEVGEVADLGLGAANESPQVLARIHRTRTNGNGRYRFDSLVPGRTVVRARGQHSGVVQQPVDLTAASRTECDLRLPVACVLTGRIRDASGTPAEGVLVRIGRNMAFGRCSAVTDADGNFRMVGISPGRCTVAAADLRGGFACCDLTFRAGQRQVWDAELRADNLTVSGQVVDARGEPFAGSWIVHRRGQGYEVCQLGPDARFALTVNQREAEAHGSIQVFASDPRNDQGYPTGNVLAAVPRVRAGAEHHVIRIPDRTDGCTLRGRVALKDGCIPQSGTAIGHRDSLTWKVAFPIRPDGSFEALDLRPGGYRLRFDGGPRRTFGPFELSGGNQHDLGMIRIGSEQLAPFDHQRRFAVLLPDRTCGCDAYTVDVLDSNGWTVNRRTQIESVHEAPNLVMALPAGTFEVRAASASGLVAKRTLVVDPAVRQRRAVLLEFRRP